MVAPKSEQLIFGPTVEGLFVRGLAGRVTPSLKAQLLSVGLDVDHIAKAYPRKVVNDAIGLAAKVLYPELSVADGWYQIGKHVVSGLKVQPLMSATVVAMRIAGPRLTLRVVARTFRQTNNYMEVQLQALGGNQYVLELRPSNEQPRYMQAVIEDMLAISGAKNLVVEILEYDASRELARYGIRFS